MCNGGYVDTAMFYGLRTISEVEVSVDACSSVPAVATFLATFVANTSGSLRQFWLRGFQPRSDIACVFPCTLLKEPENALLTRGMISTLPIFRCVGRCFLQNRARKD